MESLLSEAANQELPLTDTVEGMENQQTPNRHFPCRHLPIADNIKKQQHMKNRYIIILQLLTYLA